MYTQNDTAIEVLTQVPHAEVRGRPPSPPLARQHHGPAAAWRDLESARTSPPIKRMVIIPEI